MDHAVGGQDVGHHHLGLVDPNAVGGVHRDGGALQGGDAGGGGHDRAYSVAAHSSGDVAISGHFNGTANFNPNPGTPIEYSSNGMTDTYLTVLDSGGDLEWAHAWGAGLNDFGYGVLFL